MNDALEKVNNALDIIEQEVPLEQIKFEGIDKIRYRSFNDLMSIILCENTTRNTVYMDDTIQMHYGKARSLYSLYALYHHYARTAVDYKTFVNKLIIYLCKWHTFGWMYCSDVNKIVIQPHGGLEWQYHTYGSQRREYSDSLNNITPKDLEEAFDVDYKGEKGFFLRKQKENASNT